MTTKTLSWIAFDLGSAQVDMSTMTLVDRGIYVSLLTRCGVKGFLETDLDVLRRACGATKQHMPNIDRVLNDFFIRSDGCWLHKMVLDSQHTRSSQQGKAKKPLESKADTYTDRQTERQTNRYTDRQTEIQTEQEIKEQTVQERLEALKAVYG